METHIEVTADLDFSGRTLPLGASGGSCVSFSGEFHGNGHSIKNLKLNGAGLFCSLKDAVVEGLVIDSSCSFTGNYAGALSVSLDGSLTVKNTTNNAEVSGSWRIGGFI